MSSPQQVELYHSFNIPNLNKINYHGMMSDSNIYNKDLNFEKNFDNSAPNFNNFQSNQNSNHQNLTNLQIQNQQNNQTQISMINQNQPNFVYPNLNIHQRTNSLDTLQYPPQLQPSHFPIRSYNYSNHSNQGGVPNGNFMNHHSHANNSSISSIISITNEPYQFNEFNLNLNFNDLSDNLNNDNFSSFDSIQSVPQLSHSNSISNQSLQSPSSVNSYSNQSQAQNQLQPTQTPRRTRNTSISIQSFTTPLRNGATTSPKVSKTKTPGRRHQRTRSRLSIDATNSSLLLSNHIKSPSLNLGTNPFYTPPSFLSPKNESSDHTPLATPLASATSSFKIDESHAPPSYSISPNMLMKNEPLVSIPLSKVHGLTPQVIKREISSADSLDSIKIEDQDDDALKQLKKQKSFMQDSQVSNSTTLKSESGFDDNLNEDENTVDNIDEEDLKNLEDTQYDSGEEDDDQDNVLRNKEGENENEDKEIVKSEKIEEIGSIEQVNGNGVKHDENNMFYTAADITLKFASQMSQNQNQSQHINSNVYQDIPFIPTYNEDMNNFNLPLFMDDNIPNPLALLPPPQHINQNMTMNPNPTQNQMHLQNHLNMNVYHPQFNYGNQLQPQLLSAYPKDMINHNHMLQPQNLIPQPSIKVTDKTKIPDKKKKNHECPLCHSKFQRPEHVKRHMKSHSSEKPYHCDEPNCGKRFNRNDNLKAHLRKIHHRKV